MSDAALHGLALATSICGMAAWALSLDAHWRQLFGDGRQTSALRLTLRASGGLLLTGALAICARADPFSMAILVWAMLLTIAAASVAAGLTVRSVLSPGPRRR